MVFTGIGTGSIFFQRKSSFFLIKLRELSLHLSLHIIFAYLHIAH